MRYFSLFSHVIIFSHNLVIAEPIWIGEPNLLFKFTGKQHDGKQRTLNLFIEKSVLSVPLTTRNKKGGTLVAQSGI